MTKKMELIELDLDPYLVDLDILWPAVYRKGQVGLADDLVEAGDADVLGRGRLGHEPPDSPQGRH